MNWLYTATFDCNGGTTVHDAAREAYEVTKNLGLDKVFIRHMDRLFLVKLCTIEQGPSTPGGTIQP